MTTTPVRESLLLVCDQLPYPPRNGITLPLVNFIDQLRQTHEVSLCLLDAGGAEPAGVSWAENEARYGPILRCTLRRDGSARRVLGELRGAEMLQHGWRLVDAGALRAGAWPRVLVSPISALAKWRALRRACPGLRTGVTVAAVNDCTTAEYRYRSRAAQPGWRARAQAWSHRLRVPLIARIEADLLADCGSVLLQTAADLDAMRQLVGAATAARCVLAPNGVRADLFDVVAAPNEPQVLFVAELSGEYGALTEWLCSRVWPLVQAGQPSARLRVVGRGASPALQARLAATPGVQHLPFAPDLAAVYSQAAVVWSPLFKGYGLINKTLEAMASGLPVVGGLAAFNGIAGFVEGRHGVGLPRPDPQALAQATLQLLQSPDTRARIGADARELVRGQFSWARTADIIRQRLAAPGTGSSGATAPAAAAGLPRHQELPR